MIERVALTFDDGPDPVWTPRLLDLLDSLRVEATFFPIAPRAERVPAIIERIRSTGHSVGLHCDAHVRHSHRDRHWVEHDTDRALARLAQLGVRPALWRTPWGETAPFTPPIAAERALRLVGWDIDTHDWRGDQADEMLAATAAALRPGAVVLAHDGIGPGALRVDCHQTLEYVAAIVAHARSHGLQFQALH